VHSKLIIENPFSDPMVCSVYDINGDLVRTLKGSSGDVYWNGRNGAGRLVKPGLYIIKVEIEGSDGNYGKKMLRIIVQ
jgi:flagellar hook assembly protein FlgD